MNKTLRKLLDELDPTRIKILMIAFEEDESAWLLVDGGYYVGVNMITDPRFQVIETSGNWSMGKVMY